MTRVETNLENIRDDVRDHGADIRQLRDWRNDMAGAATASIRAAGQRFIVAGLLLTMLNIGVSVFLR